MIVEGARPGSFCSSSTSVKPSISGIIWSTSIRGYGSPAAAGAAQLRDGRRPAVHGLGTHVPKPQKSGEDAAVGLVVVHDQDGKPCRADGFRRRRFAGRRRGLFETGREAERAALADLALDPDLAPHEGDQPRRNRQSQAGAAEPARRRAVGLRERVENDATAFRRGCRCPCRSRQMPADSRRPDWPSNVTRTTTSPRSVNLIALPDQIDEHLPQPAGVADRRGRERRSRCRKRVPVLCGAPAGPAFSACRPAGRAAETQSGRDRACLPRSWKSRGCR